MDNNLPVNKAPVTPEEQNVRDFFTPLRGVFAFLSLFLAYLYTYFFTDVVCYDEEKDNVIAILFVFLFILTVELARFLEKDRAGTDIKNPLTETSGLKEFLFSENSFWILCIILTTIGMLYSKNRTWNDLNLLFVHCYAVYYAFQRSGRLTKGKSSSYVVIDGFRAFFVFPIRNYMLKVRTLFIGLKSGFSKKETSGNLIWFLGAIIVAGVLLFIALFLLSEADDKFKALYDYIRIDFTFDSISEFIIRTTTSIFISSYFYGLIFGPYVKGQASGEEIERKTDDVMTKAKKVPAMLWSLLVLLFVFVYAVFFVIQAEYLFSALFAELPEGFTASSYARQGFFELCKILIINFILLFLMSRTSSEGKKVRLLKASEILLLIESLLFCVTAFSKLYLYIDRFGFTPLRIKSSWLVSVLFLGCALYLINVLSKRKTFRIWLLIACGSLAVLQMF